MRACATLPGLSACGTRPSAASPTPPCASWLPTTVLPPVLPMAGCGCCAISSCARLACNPCDVPCCAGNPWGWPPRGVGIPRSPPEAWWLLVAPCPELPRTSASAAASGCCRIWCCNGRGAAIPGASGDVPLGAARMGWGAPIIPAALCCCSGYIPGCSIDGGSTGQGSCGWGAPTPSPLPTAPEGPACWGGRPNGAGNM